MNKSREYLLRRHNNDYLKLCIINEANETSDQSTIINVNIVIPLFNGGDIFDITLEYTNFAIKKAKELIPMLHVSVTVVDDGSEKPYAFPSDKSHPDWNIVRLDKNRGRAFSRNTGLQYRTASKYTIFMDADIILYPNAISDFIREMERFSTQNRSCITCGLFHFIYLNTLNKNKISFDISNDFRLNCNYQENWIGCENDREFIGAEFNIIKDTAGWSKWPASGKFGPWTLPNMVLGGLFCVNTHHALSVGGFDDRFSAYGFEETTLATKLIIMKGSFVVPILGGFSKHIEEENGESKRNEKDRLFRRAYDRYFHEFMKEPAIDIHEE
ncbi:glycosyltransferase family A protein [Superficieibacter sp. HKU1]|uniref:glycosyltransferase family A protein n=1 Tax=Superficieibacter sp. HKU1 TaxID=3031919 RepID=UPI0023E1D1D7|nr:glycosyltransferase family A protein [Superficieibacter sp. HKU1]WES68342.1 glycosyltransferase family A protein [Superficieibacter sp. HKU1]